jgi:hypothetical protein
MLLNVKWLYILCLAKSETFSNIASMQVATTFPTTLG